MARKKAEKSTVRLRREIAERLAVIREEFLGERGAPELARRLGIPIRSWYNYERGIAMPGEVLLRFIEITFAEPAWLLHGRGRRYYRASTDTSQEIERQTDTSVTELARRLLELVQGRSTTEEPAWPRGHDPGFSIENAPDWIQISDDDMAPVVVEGGWVKVAHVVEQLADLDGKLVLARVEGRQVVRWYRHHERFGRLSLKRTMSGAGDLLIDSRKASDYDVRRIVRVNTPH